MTPQQRKAAAVALATALAAPAEGIRRVWYYDPPGVVTVCRGHTGPDIDKSKVYSIPECDALLDKDMARAADIVDRCVPGLEPHVLGAFADVTYNTGSVPACDTTRSTAARMLKAGNIKGACLQILRWDKAKVGGMMISLLGLTKRRKQDSDLCLKGLA